MSEHFDIAIIGAGPGGLGAATNAARQGLSHILIEKSEIGNTIYEYQLRKHVMAEPTKLPLRSHVRFEPGTREDILDWWNTAISECTVNVRTVETRAIKKQADVFHIDCGGQSITASNVILAIGVQGTPRKLGVPGDDMSHVAYTLADPDAFEDMDILVVGAGDAAIENALALVDKNRVSLLNRTDSFPRAKDANVAKVLKAIQAKKLRCYYDSAVSEVREDAVTLTTPEGDIDIPCNHIIARIGAIPPRAFMEAIGIEFPNADRMSVPVVSNRYESNVPGLFLVGALIGYPLIKHALNQGHEVVEHILGNTVEPADQVLIQETFAPLNGDTNEILAQFKTALPLFRELSESQFREMIIDSTVHTMNAGDIVFNRNDYTDTFFSIVSGGVEILLPNDQVISIEAGRYFGEMGLLSGRRRNATVRAKADTILLETPRNQMLKLIASVEDVKTQLDRVFMRNALLQSILTDSDPALLDQVVQQASLKNFKKNEVIFREGDDGDALYVIRKGSVKISRKNAAGVDVAQTYLPAGNYVGEMALLEEQTAPRTATVTAAVPCETIVISKEVFRTIIEQDPRARATVTRVARERGIENLTVSQDEYSGDLLEFMTRQGVTDAENVLLIDSDLCVGCDNCESACAATHGGYSRLDRKGGKSFAAIQLPVSCRHCENPLCMLDCPPDALRRMPDGEVIIDDSCIGCGNCQTNCPYGVIQMVYEKPARSLFSLFKAKNKNGDSKGPAKAGKCDMCRELSDGPACVRACPTGAAFRVNPSKMLAIISSKREVLS